MIISHKHKFIFVRPRKVAGTSVARALYQFLGEEDQYTQMQPSSSDRDDAVLDLVKRKDVVRGLGPHCSPKQILDSGQISRDKWNEYTKITIIRNPFSQQVSGYWWHTRGGISFEKYLVDSHIDDSKFYIDRTGRRICDIYLRFEHLEEDYRNLCEKFGFEYSPLIKTKNRVRKDKHYSEMYSQFTKRLVESRSSQILKEFNYEFEQQGDLALDTLPLHLKAKVLLLEPLRKYRRTRHKLQ